MRFFTEEEWADRMLRFGEYVPMAKRSSYGYDVDVLGRRLPKHRPSHPALDDVILDNLSTRFEVPSMELYAAVVGDYGTLNRRVFYRHLAWLRSAGKAVVVRTESAGAHPKLFYRRAKAVSPSK